MVKHHSQAKFALEFYLNCPSNLSLKKEWRVRKQDSQNGDSPCAVFHLSSIACGLASCWVRSGRPQFRYRLQDKGRGGPAPHTCHISRVVGAVQTLRTCRGSTSYSKLP